MPTHRRKSPALIHGYATRSRARTPLPGGRHRGGNLATPVSTASTGYFHETIEKGRTRNLARGTWIDNWIEIARLRFAELRDVSKTAIRRFWRKMGMTPPHHGKRKASPAEAAKELAFTDYMGYTRPAAAQLYPTLEGGAETVEGAALPAGVDSAGRPTSPRTTMYPLRSAGPTRR